MSAPSARGLFRATGKKGKPIAAYDLTGSIVKVDALEREANEFYPTPVDPIRALIHAERDRLQDFPLIWGPACGTGVIGAELRSAGFQTYDSDLIDRGCGAIIRDFYAFSRAPGEGPAAIVENPPYAECNERDGKGRWIWHAMETLGVEYMALLLNYGWPGAGGHDALWEKYPPARIHLMTWKIDFTGQGAPPMLNAWFVWDRKWRGDTRFYRLGRKDARQAELFADSA